MLFEANQALFWSLYKHTSGQKEAKLPKTLFTGQVKHHTGFFPDVYLQFFKVLTWEEGQMS